jgi:predicted double-glycine peptidase
VDANSQVLRKAAPVSNAATGDYRPSRAMRTRVSLACTCGVVALLATTPAAQIGVGSGLRIEPPAMSMKDLRDRDLVKQRFDFSCGAAALATILRYGFGDHVTEAQILVSLFDQLSEEEKAVARSSGFSLLHLQRVALARNYDAQGFRLEPGQLAMLAGPVIVYIEPRGYRHFAVLRGMRGDRVYLADPSRGNIRLPVHAFLDSWLREDGRGIIFAVEPKSTRTNSPMPLSLGKLGQSRPEVMSAREMLAVGDPLARWPALSR